MAKGRYGDFGGQYIPETLMNEIHKLEDAYEFYKNDKQFNDEMTLSGSKVETIERLDESLKNTGSGGNELTWNDRSMTSEDIGGTIYFPSVLGDSFDVVAVAFDADKLPGKMVSATVTFPSSLDPATVAMKIPTSSVVRSYKQITALQLMNRTSHLTRYDLK